MRVLFVHIANNICMKKQLTLLTLLVPLVFGMVSPVAAKVITVQKGDSMWLIAKRYNVSFSEVLHLNKAHHVDVNLIHPNDKIYLPDKGTGTNTTQSSDNDNIAHGNETAVQTEIPAQAEAVLNLVNAERKKQGLNSLTLSSELTNIATLKSKDMAVNGYFDHTSPTYGDPFQMLQKFGVSYRSAGENIAYNQRTPEEVMTAWLNSSGHRANILNKSYTQLGVGYYTKNGSPYWTQLFIGQ